MPADLGWRQGLVMVMKAVLWHAIGWKTFIRNESGRLPAPRLPGQAVSGPKRTASRKPDNTGTHCGFGKDLGAESTLWCEKHAKIIAEQHAIAATVELCGVLRVLLPNPESACSGQLTESLVESAQNAWTRVGGMPC